MDRSYLISLAIPGFYLLMFVEYLFGVLTGKNNYRLNDSFAAISLGLISRLPPVLNLGFQGAVFAHAASSFNLKLLPTESWFTWGFAFVLYDLTYYWMHRLHHEVKVLWATHVVHHQGEEFNLSTALRQSGTGWLWKWIFFVPMIILGIPPEVFITVGGLNLIYQFWVHTEHIPKLGVLEKVFITPSNHRIHHAQNKEYIDANYGGVFILWDRCFGTFIEERPELKPIYGTVKSFRSWNPLWANVEIFYQMIRDTFYTRSIKDKFKVWFSDTGWRPDDVAVKFPSITNNLDEFRKYDPLLSRDTRIYSLVQLFMMTLIALAVFFTLDSQSYFETVIFGILLVATATISSIILEKVKGSYYLELVRSVCVILLFSANFINTSLFVSQTFLIHALLNILLISIIHPLKQNLSFNK